MWANGNGGEDDDCAADGFASSIYTISVGSIGVNGTPSHFDEECSAKMVVTYVTNLDGYSSVVYKPYDINLLAFIPVLYFSPQLRWKEDVHLFLVGQVQQHL